MEMNMTFTEWYKLKYHETWEQREYRYFYCGIGKDLFYKAIPEYINEYYLYCKLNKKEPNIDIKSMQYVRRLASLVYIISVTQPI
jgi:hypothetical protein